MKVVIPVKYAKWTPLILMRSLHALSLMFNRDRGDSSGASINNFQFSKQVKVFCLSDNKLYIIFILI